MAPCVAFYNASGRPSSPYVTIVLDECFLTASRLYNIAFSPYTACRPFLPSPGFRRLTSRVSVHEGPPFGSRVGPATRVPRFLPGFAGHLFSGLPRAPSLLEKAVCQYVLSLCRSRLRRATRARASRAFPTYLAASTPTPGWRGGGTSSYL